VLPSLDYERDGLYLPEGDHWWLDGPVATADALHAPVVVNSQLNLAVLRRDAAGAWSVLGDAQEWEHPGAGALMAHMADGSLLLVQSGRNIGRVGTMTPEGAYRQDTTRFGTHDYGLRFSSFLDPFGTPALIGRRTVVETYAGGRWTQSGELVGYLVTEDSLADRLWDPIESGSLTDIRAATDGGATILMGSAILDGENGTYANVTGWFRGSETEPWSPLQGLATPRSEFVSSVVRTGGMWIAVGSGRESFSSIDPETAMVWTSSDGVNWGRVDGPFAAAAGAESWASGACALPSGDPLVVGHTNEGGHDRPALWRSTGGQWQRIDGAALDAEFGALSSCSSQGDMTIVQGSRDSRETVWRTSDGSTFAAARLGSRGDSFSTIRAVEGGFAAAGSRSSDGQAGAVVWLSEDAQTWRAVPLPSQRQLSGADVMPDGSGGLFVAANSGSAPEVWRLANPGELFQAG
jgi:hypothetical protein